jgi:Spore cortex protein YabQ (Spore_YabQ).
MGIYLAEQTLAFLQAILLGGLFGLLYDCFRISRIAVPTSDRMVTVEDTIYWLICAAVTFLFLLGSIGGHVRIFLLVGGVLGGVLYYGMLSPLVMGVCRAVIDFIKGLVRLFIRVVIRPIWQLLCRTGQVLFIPVRYLWKIAHKIGLKFKFSLKIYRLLLYNQFTRPQKQDKRGGRRAIGTEKDG